MHRLFVTIGVTGLCLVTHAALQPVRLICKSIDRSERFRSRWVAVGLIAGLMALAIAPSAAVAKPRDCDGSLDRCNSICDMFDDGGKGHFNCGVQCTSEWFQCNREETKEKEKEKPVRGSKSGPRGSKRDVPVNASVPNPGVLNPNVGGTSRSTNAAPSGSTGAANRSPAAQPTTGGGNATTNPGAIAGSSTGAILSPTGPGQGVGSLLGGTASPRGIGSATGGTYGRQSR